MRPDLDLKYTGNLPETLVIHSQKKPKQPRSILENVFAFAPNRDTLGGTSYLILSNSGNILVDCPPTDAIALQFLQDVGGARWLFLTHRGGISKQIGQIQTDLGCEVIVQEQEAYLIPEVNKTPFSDSFTLNNNSYGFWSPGHSPGSSCLYWGELGGVLFTGRHLLPESPEAIAPLRVAKTFHWSKQLQSVAALLSRFDCENLEYICPGANTGFLRGKGFIDRAYSRLSQLDLAALETKTILF